MQTIYAFVIAFVYKQINQKNVMFGSIFEIQKNKIDVLSENSWSLGNVILISAL